MGNLSLFDAHVHLSWFENPEEAAAQAQKLGIAALCCTVSPREYKEACALLSKCANVRVAAGLHPWFGDETTDVNDAVEVIEGSAWVGEVGLDFGAKHADSKRDQLRVFEAVCEACSDGGKTLSLHSVRSAETVLDVLEKTGAIDNCRCVFHWFSGTSEELMRAKEAGCWFSVGERMLGTRRGREYARQIPTSRLLLETDLPEVRKDGTAATDIAKSLTRAANILASIKKGWEPSQARLF